MSDRNYRSYVGPGDDRISLKADDWVNPPDGGEGYSDVFKCSNVRGLSADGLRIDGARCAEDALDCVRGGDYHFSHCEVVGRVTVKGAIDGWLFSHTTFHRGIEVGQFDNYWQPGKPATRHGCLRRCRTPGTGKVRVLLWDAEPPVLEDTAAEIWRVPKVIWFPYFCWRYLVIRISP